MALSGTLFFTDSRLVSYYPFDADSNDDKGSNNGTDTNISYVTGKFGNGAQLGATSLIKFASPTYKNLSTGTLSYWYAESATGHGDVHWKLNDSGDTNVELYSEFRGDTTNIVSYVTRDSTPSTTFYGSIPGSDDTSWHHVAWTSDGSTLKGYYDGALQTITVTTGSNSGQFFDDVASADDFYLTVTAGGTRIIDDLAIFNDDLSAAEIADIYNDVQLGSFLALL